MSACQYLYRKQLTIDYTKLGSNCGASGVTEFPVLISMSGVTDIKTTAYGGRVENSSGYDIMFRDSTGINGLYYEIEKYDESTGTLVAWVRVPTVSGTANTPIYMYYGNACVLSGTTTTSSVWDSNFKGVFVLEIFYSAGAVSRDKS